MAAAFQRRTVMRRPEEYQVAQVRGPRISGLACLETRAPCHQSTHAVPEDRQFLHWTRRMGHECFKQVRQPAAVVRDVQAAVVTHVQWRVTEFVGEGRAMVEALVIPLKVVEAQTMYE